MTIMALWTDSLKLVCHGASEDPRLLSPYGPHCLMKRPIKCQPSSAMLSGRNPHGRLHTCFAACLAHLVRTAMSHHALKTQVWALGLIFWEWCYRTPYARSSTPTVPVTLMSHSLCVHRLWLLVPLGIESHVGQAGLKLCS